ncbi:hypothetical protein Ae201684P_012695 [Aphanomyces euteiches]|nr:hypothetical protein Ae201684P_012695 [Aphanomyces euteiches]
MASDDDDGWITCTDDKGKTYKYNPNTCEVCLDDIPEVVDKAAALMATNEWSDDEETYDQPLTSPNDVKFPSIERTREKDQPASAEDNDESPGPEVAAIPVLPPIAGRPSNDSPRRLESPTQLPPLGGEGHPSLLLSWNAMPPLQAISLPPLNAPNDMFPSRELHPMVDLLEPLFHAKRLENEVREWMRKKKKLAKAAKPDLAAQASSSVEKEQRQAQSKEKYKEWLEQKKAQKRQQKATARLKKRQEQQERINRLEAQDAAIRQLQQQTKKLVAKGRRRKKQTAASAASIPHITDSKRRAGALRKKQEADLADTLLRLDEVERVLIQVAQRVRKRK